MRDIGLKPQNPDKTVTFTVTGKRRNFNVSEL